MEVSYPVVSIGVNGSMIYCRYDYSATSNVDLTVSILAEWVDSSDAFTTPINIIFCDSRGEAARVVVKGKGEKFKFLN